MTRKRIYTYGGKPARRNYTVADMTVLKGGAKLCQTCPATEEEAAACEAVGIDVLNTSDADLPAVRAGAPETFIIADLPMTAHQTPDDIMRAAVKAAEAGADAVYTPRSLRTVEMLANEGLAVQGHLGLVPRLSTRRGGLRIVGKTADEALELAEDFRRLEDAGAYAAEVECVAAEALATINPLTKLVTHSIGAGSAGDVIFMFLVDICGESDRPPGHAKAFADLGSIRAHLAVERRRALSDYRQAVMTGAYPDAATSVSMLPNEHQKLLEALAARSAFNI
ncbi:MAG: 3-methyl-2-oxobutanoate hydroxymethyltransferase [Rhodospirillales bacterium]|nr:3-methyl-2-oxobutanoate hydroxymethyltransferase [Rhodospirillales bacterium]MDE0378219.1 3-methyl-2-oxobutanoate hydroxymethyltransferase [Rhodospirillales bacterium]